MNAERIAKLRQQAESDSVLEECLSAIEARDRVLQRLRYERDQAVLQLAQVRRPLIPGGARRG